MQEKRQCPRFPIESRIKVMHPSIGVVMLTTRDVSDSGAFLYTHGIVMPRIGTVVSGQIQDVPADAPVVEMEIVRVTAEGIGVRFVDDVSND